MIDEPIMDIWDNEVVPPEQIKVVARYDPLELKPFTMKDEHVTLWERLWICSPRGAAFRKIAEGVADVTVDFDAVE